MLFIMGFAGLVTAICSLFPGNFSDVIAGQMSHTQWDGLTHHDTIFPLFIFVAGVTFPFSLAKQRTNGRPISRIVLRIVKRGAVLILLGIIYNNFPKLDFANMRYASVLARIGLAWMFASLIYLFCGRKWSAIITAAILVGYSLLLYFVRAPDAPIGCSSLSFDGNIVGWVDRQILPGRLFRGTFDPEGILSTIPAIATALLGVLTGDYLKNDSFHHTRGEKALWMAVSSALLIAIGIVWSHWIPVNKNLWSSSFACVVAGYSLGMLTLFYYLIDVKGWKRWSLFFNVIGLNSITIYIAQKIIGFQKISDFFLTKVASMCPDAWALVINRTGYVIVCWLFLYFLYKQKIFLKV